MKRILVTGSRDWDDWPTLCEALNNEGPLGGELVTIIHGGASGADSMAHGWASCLPGHAYPEVHPADWETYGRRAGFVRNAEMVNAGADVCLAFIRAESKGATMCARLAEKAGIPVRYFRRD
jgi:hypothetical protein